MEVIHGVEGEMSFDGGRTNVVALACFFHSLGCYLESSKAE